MLTWPGRSKNSAWARRLGGRDANARAKCLSGLLLGEPERQRLTDPGSDFKCILLTESVKNVSG